MTKPIVKILNLETGEEIEREMNAAEFAQYKVDQDLRAAQKVEETLKANAKAALLERLGMTAEEAALLFS
jgi:hypothetical protein